MSDGECLIWGTYADRLELPGFGLVNSLRVGGCYAYPRDPSPPPLGLGIFGPLQGLDDRAKARLTTLLVDQRRLLGHEPPITTLLDPRCLLGHERPNLTVEMIESAKDKPDLPVGERADRLLQYFEKQAPRMGELVGQIDGTNIDEEGYAWSESVNESEYFSLCGFLEEQKWLECFNDAGDPVPQKITAQGYIHLEELRQGD